MLGKLRPGREYQLRVISVSENGTVGRFVESAWIRILAGVLRVRFSVRAVRSGNATVKAPSALSCGETQWWDEETRSLRAKCSWIANPSCTLFFAREKNECCLQIRAAFISWIGTTSTRIRAGSSQW